MRYSVADAKNNFSRLLKEAEAGEEVLITRNGKAMARISSEPDDSLIIDLDWLDRMRVHPQLHTTDSAAIIRAMRDEGY
jgi:prevent-host-death family protein